MAAFLFFYVVPSRSCEEVILENARGWAGLGGSFRFGPPLAFGPHWTFFFPFPSYSHTR